MTESEILQLKNFLSAAIHGKHRAASSGEHAAHYLSKQAEKISFAMQDLDADKQEGFILLLKGLAWPDTREMLLKRLP